MIKSKLLKWVTYWHMFIPSMSSDLPKDVHRYGYARWNIVRPTVGPGFPKGSQCSPSVLQLSRSKDSKDIQMKINVLPGFILLLTTIFYL